MQILNLTDMNKGYLCTEGKSKHSTNVILEKLNMLKVTFGENLLLLLVPE